MLKIINFILEKIAVKFNNFKLKKFVDSGFITVEKIIVKLSKLHKMYLSFYEELISLEVEFADISNKDKILHIGCGPLPATAIILAEKTNANITAIDKNPRSVKQANKCVTKQIKTNKINILLSDALNFSYKNYNVIIISQGIKPCKKILENISKNIKNETRLIYRTSTDNSGKLSENDAFLKDFFKIIDIKYHKKNGLLISVLLKKIN